MNIKLKLEKLVDDFLAFSTLHGLNYVGEKRRSKFLRCVWLIGVIVMFAVLTVNIYWEYEEYKQYNFITKTEIKFRSQLEFPAITLCNAHSFDKNKLNKTSDDDNIAAYFTNSYRTFTSQNKFNFLSEKWHNVTVSVEDITKSTFNIYDTIAGAYIIDNKTGYTILTEKFNYVFPFAMTPCFTLNEQWFKKKYSPLQFGLDSKLIMYINVNQVRYAFESLTSGMSVYIHPPDEPALMSQPSVKLSPGQYYDIKLSYKQYQYLPAPYNSYQNSNCVDKSQLSDQLKYFPRYSQSACLLECLTDMVIEQCGCVVEYLVYNASRYPFCSVYQREYCAHPLSIQFIQNAQNSRDNCSCPLTCSEDVFERQLSSEFFPSESIIDYLVGMNFTTSLHHARNNLMRVDISYSNLKREQIIHQPKLYLSDVVSVLGGYMGFFLGASIFTLMELLDLIIRSIITVISSYFTTEIKPIKISVVTKSDN